MRGLHIKSAEESSCDFQHWWGWQRTRSESDVRQLGMTEGPKDSQRGNFKAWWTCMKYPQGMYGNDVTVGWNVGPRDLQTCADWLALCGTNFWPGVMLDQSHCIPAYTWIFNTFFCSTHFWLDFRSLRLLMLPWIKKVRVCPPRQVFTFVPRYFPSFPGKVRSVLSLQSTQSGNRSKVAQLLSFGENARKHISLKWACIYLCFFRSFEGAGMTVIRSSQSCRFTLQSRPALLRSWWLWYDCEREACGSTGKSHSNSYLVAELLTIHLFMMSWHVLERPSLIKSFSMFLSCFLCRRWLIICFDICFDQSLNTWVDIVDALYFGPLTFVGLTMVNPG